MNEGVKFTPSEVIATRENFARRGADMFIAVSKDYPASVACQAAQIALLCQTEGYSPLTIGTDIGADPEAQSRIIKAANNAHGKHGKEPVDPSFALEIINSVFKFADTAMPLNTFTLARILDAYPATGSIDERTELALQSRIRDLTSYKQYLA